MGQVGYKHWMHDPEAIELPRAQAAQHPEAPVENGGRRAGQVENHHTQNRGKRRADRVRQALRERWIKRGEAGATLIATRLMQSQGGARRLLRAQEQAIRVPNPDVVVAGMGPLPKRCLFSTRNRLQFLESSKDHAAVKGPGWLPYRHAQKKWLSSVLVVAFSIHSQPPSNTAKQFPNCGQESHTFV